MTNKSIDLSKFYAKINDILKSKGYKELSAQEKQILLMIMSQSVSQYNNDLEHRQDLSEFAISKQLEFNLLENIANVLNQTRKNKNAR